MMYVIMPLHVLLVFLIVIELIAIVHVKVGILIQVLKFVKVVIINVLLVLPVVLIVKLAVILIDL